MFVRKRPRTHVSSTERLDDVYVPRLHVDNRYRHYFDPTTIVDANGELNVQLAPDVLGSQETVRILGTTMSDKKKATF